MTSLLLSSASFLPASIPSPPSCCTHSACPGMPNNASTLRYWSSVSTHGADPWQSLDHPRNAPVFAAAVRVIWMPGGNDASQVPEEQTKSVRDAEMAPLPPPSTEIRSVTLLPSVQ